MASVNKVILVGNIVRDPEVRYMPNGEAVTNVTIACNDSYKDKTTGEKKEVVEFVRVVFFRKLAEIAGQYLKKGSQVYVEGSLKTRKWQDKDGQDRYTTEVVADTMKMLGSKRDDDQSAPPADRPAAKPAAAAPGGFDDFVDDIPFASCSMADDVIVRKFKRRSSKFGGQ